MAMYASASADDIAAGLEQLGVIHAGENNRRLEVMRAEAIGALRRLGVDVSISSTIDSIPLNHDLERASQSTSSSARMRLKAGLCNAGILLDRLRNTNHAAAPIAAWCREPAGRPASPFATVPLFSRALGVPSRRRERRRVWPDVRYARRSLFHFHHERQTK